MKICKFFILVIGFIACLFPNRVNGQELNCEVEINADQVQATNKQVFSTLKDAINEYMNTNKFSNAQFSVNEKINCRLFFTIKEYNDNTMIGDLQIQSSRPVYNSSYTTTLINFKDTKVEFSYQENEPLIFSENNMESNLTAILNFYAYLILAIDFDSFSPKGGEAFYERAQNVVQMAQSSGESGWKAFEDTKNRSAVLSAYTEPNTSIIRTLIYEYHRLGLDEMVLSPDKGRAKISSTLDYLKKIYDVAPMSVGLSMFKDAKLDELVNLYTKSSQTERDNAYEILSSLYPTENDRLNKIKAGTNK
ncbi:MAG: DUF4835 family protein [Muribaculaceae bacterium]|jgi:hypothetical protein|nr:DUF4835 family protein [Muribaculaceae bacterium]MBR5551893.1 DUF4835 family protein [Muribaculaceae bacterium]